MTSNKQQAGGRGRITRRTALTSIAAVGLLGVGTVSARGDNVEVLRHGTRDDPIDPDEIVDLQEDSFARHSGGVDPVVVEPDRDDRRDIVAYAHFVDGDGVMHSYVGSVLPDDAVTPGAPRAVGRRHRRAEVFLDGSGVDSPSAAEFGVSDATGIRHLYADFGAGRHGTLLTTYDAFEGGSTVALGGTHRVVPSGASNSTDVSSWLRRDWDTSWLHDTTVQDCGVTGGVETTFAVRYDVGAVRWAPDTLYARGDGDALPASSDQPFAWSGSLDEPISFQCVTVADAGRCQGRDGPGITGRRELRFGDSLDRSRSFDSTYRFLR